MIAVVSNAIPEKNARSESADGRVLAIAAICDPLLHGRAAALTVGRQRQPRKRLLRSAPALKPFWQCCCAGGSAQRAVPGGADVPACTYRRVVERLCKRGLERVMGIEPTLAAWEAAVLPLNYTRAGLRDSSECAERRATPSRRP